MKVEQITKWKTEDGSEFNTEDEALVHAIKCLRRDELQEVLDEVWHRSISKEDVIEVLMDNFIFTKKE